MTDLFVFPDAAAVVCVALVEELDVQAGTKVPNPRPTEFVLARRTGGPRLNLVADDAQISIECWAATDEAAHDLAQRARSVVHAMRGTVVDGVTVYRVAEFTGPQDLPDPISHQPRYVFTVSIAMRGSTVTGS